MLKGFKWHSPQCLSPSLIFRMNSFFFPVISRHWLEILFFFLLWQFVSNIAAWMTGQISFIILILPWTYHGSLLFCTRNDTMIMKTLFVSSFPVLRPNSITALTSMTGGEHVEALRHVGDSMQSGQSCPGFKCFCSHYARANYTRRPDQVYICSTKSYCQLWISGKVFGIDKTLNNCTHSMWFHTQILFSM